MHLESLADQTVRISGRPFRFRAGETLHTESSYKTTPPAFQAMAARAGWTTLKSWTSPKPFTFALMLLRAPA